MPAHTGPEKHRNKVAGGRCRRTLYRAVDVRVAEPPLLTGVRAFAAGLICRMLGNERDPAFDAF